MSILKAENLIKIYGQNEVKALDNISLEVEQGEFVAIVGSSGSGKSTLLNMLGGLDKLTSGDVYINNKKLGDMKDEELTIFRRRNIGFIFQNYNLVPILNVYENIVLPIELDGVKIDEDYIDSIVNTLGLNQKLTNMPNNLSGGQQQRVALARALVAKPSLMLLDEPLNNLDANLREEMRFEIKELQKKLGITILYVTHDQEIALAISDRLAIMNEHGDIQQIGTPWDIYERSENEMVFKFMGLANFIPVRYQNNHHYIGEGNQILNWKNLPPNSGKLGCRPSDIILSKNNEGLLGKVSRASFLGAVMDYMVEIDGVTLRTEIPTNKALRNNLMFNEGENCFISFHDLLWFDSAKEI